MKILNRLRAPSTTRMVVSLLAPDSLDFGPDSSFSPETEEAINMKAPSAWSVEIN